MARPFLHLVLRAFQVAKHLFAAVFSATANRFWISALRRKLQAEAPTRDLLVIGLVQHIGDIIAAEPVVRRLRETHPNTFLVWFARPPYLELARNFGSLDAVLPVSCLTGWMLMRKFGGLGRYVDLHVKGQACSVCAIRLRKPEDRSGVDGDNYFEFGSLTDIFARIAGLSEYSAQPSLSIPATITESVRRLQLPEKYLAVHTASEQALKNWPEKHWHEFAQRIWSEMGVHIIEVGLNSVLARAKSTGGLINMCGRLSLLETAEVIRKSRLFIGVDSGPGHMANAVGTYGIILLGPYFKFREYNPYGHAFATGESGLLLRGESVAMIPIERVYAAVKLRLM